MILKLFDKTQIVITKEQSEKIKQALAQGATHIELGDNWINASSIASITVGGTIEVDTLALPKGRTDYRGQTSKVKDLIKAKMKQGKSFKEIAKEL